MTQQGAVSPKTREKTFHIILRLLFQSARVQKQDVNGHHEKATEVAKEWLVQSMPRGTVLFMNFQDTCDLFDKR
eukprot:scaffold84305_cov20-Prasinocladus_malaysianus.AAC.1